jgi:hypothetical protein
MTTQAFSSRVALLTALTLAPWAMQARAAVVDANPSNYQSLVSALAPGDTLRLAPGTYTHGLSLGGTAGTAAHPIIVTGPKDHSAVFTALDCCNTVQLDSTSFLQLRNLALDTGVAAGVDSRGNSHHITLENLNISGEDANARTVGIAAHDQASDWVIRRDVITGVETGLHFDAPLVGGLIEFNVVVDTAGSNVEVPANSPLTTVRYNAFRDSMRASESEQTYGNVVYASASADVNNAYVQASSQGAGTMQWTIAAVGAAAAVTPTLTMSASPTNVASGGTSIVSWTSTGVDGCSASGGWIGTKGPSGSETVGPLQSATSYQLTCLGAGGNAGAMVQVTVGGTSTPPPSNPPPMNPPPSNPPSDPTPTNPPPSNPPPSNPDPTNPTPTQPTPTQPTPTQPTPTQPSNPPSVPAPSTGNSMSGGGGSLDGVAIALLVLLAFWRGLRRSVNPS